MVLAAGEGVHEIRVGDAGGPGERSQAYTQGTPDCRRITGLVPFEYNFLRPAVCTKTVPWPAPSERLDGLCESMPNEVRDQLCDGWIGGIIKFFL